MIIYSKKLKQLEKSKRNINIKVYLNFNFKAIKFLFTYI